MCTENINLQYKTNFTIFDQNTAEFYDKHFLLTVFCIFWPKFWLKPHYFALHLTKNGEDLKKIKHCSPLDTRSY